MKTLLRTTIDQDKESIHKKKFENFWINLRLIKSINIIFILELEVRTVIIKFSVFTPKIFFLYKLYLNRD